MALKANKDTYAFEQVGPETFVRREIKAGHQVPEGLYADEEGQTPFEGDEVGGGRQTSGYEHQNDPEGNILEEHKPKVAAYEPPVKEGEVVTGQEQGTTEDVEMQSGADKPKKAEIRSNQPTEQPAGKK